MKILFISTLYTPNVVGGAERSVQFVAEALVRLGHTVIVVSVAQTPAAAAATVDGVKVYYLGLGNVYWPFGAKAPPAILKPLWHLIDSYNPFMARAVGKILDHEGVDIVHSDNPAGFSVAIWSAARKRGIPLVHTLRDYYLLCPRATMFRADRNCESQCAICRTLAIPRKNGSQSVDAVFGASRFTLNQHLSRGYFGRARIREVTRNAYTAEDVAAAPRRRGGPIRLGFMGRLQRSKGVELLLETCERLPAADYELWLAGVGDQGYENHLRQRFHAPGSRFMGYVPLASFLERIDVLVIPSLWHEPLARILTEAYAHGVPVISSNRGGLPELVEEGKTGFLFDPSVAGSLEQAILRFSRDRDLATRMRDQVMAKSRDFLPERVAADYLDVYARILNDHETVPLVKGSGNAA